MTQQTSDRIDVGIRVLREFGFPCLMLSVVMWWGHLAAITIHDSVVVPWIESHTEFVKATSETLKSLGETQERQAATLEEIATGQRDIQRVLEKGG